MIEYPSDESVISSMASLLGNHDFGRIVQWLKAERDNVAKRAMSMTGEGVERMQGAYLALDQFIGAVKDSRDVLESRQSRRQKTRTRIP
jgi:hypothetical protein